MWRGPGAWRLWAGVSSRGVSPPRLDLLDSVVHTCYSHTHTHTHTHSYSCSTHFRMLLPTHTRIHTHVHDSPQNTLTHVHILTHTQTQVNRATQAHTTHTKLRETQTLSIHTLTSLFLAHTPSCIYTFTHIHFHMCTSSQSTHTYDAHKDIYTHARTHTTCPHTRTQEYSHVYLLTRTETDVHNHTCTYPRTCSPRCTHTCLDTRSPEHGVSLKPQNSLYSPRGNL